MPINMDDDTCILGQDDFMLQPLAGRISARAVNDFAVATILQQLDFVPDLLALIIYMQMHLRSTVYVMHGLLTT